MTAPRKRPHACENSGCDRPASVHMTIARRCRPAEAWTFDLCMDDAIAELRRFAGGAYTVHAEIHVV